MKQLLLKYSYPLALLCFTVLFLFVYLVLEVRFVENDDNIMALIASGAYSGTPDSHLVFIQVIFGLFLKTLYSWFPGLEWYTLSFVGLQIISAAAITVIISKTPQRNMLKLALGGFLVAVFVYCSVYLQFTSVAAFAAIAGISLILQRQQWLGGAILFVIGSLIRFEAAVLILMISLPLWGVFTQTLAASFKHSKVRILIALVGLSILCKAVDTAYYYSDPDWKYYIQYNKIRGKINDNPNGRRASLELPPLLSKEDYELLLNFTPNPEAIDLALLQQIHQAIDQKTLSPKLRNVKQLLWYGPWLLLAFVYMGMLFFEQEKTAKLQMLASSVIFIGLLGFVTLNATLKARVFFPAFGAYIFFCCWVSGQALQHRKMVIASTAILLVSLGLLVKSYTWSASLRPKIATYERQLSMIHHYLGEGKKLAVYRGSLPLEKNDPFTLSASFPTQQIYLSGWMTGIPFHKGKYDAFDFFIEKNGLFVHQQNSFSKTAALVGASILQHDTIMVRSRVASEAEACAIIEFDELSSFDEN